MMPEGGLGKDGVVDKKLELEMLIGDGFVLELVQGKMG